MDWCCSKKVGDVLALRLVDVGAGALVKIRTAPLPVSDPESWSKLMAAEVAKVAINLPLRSKKISPVSLLRINAAHGGSQGAALEESLNLLLSERLSGNAGLVLLERWRLLDAVAEKELAAVGGDFWNSSWVVDGAVTPSASGYSLHLRLQPPGGKAAREIKAESPELPALVELANAEILAVLQRPVTPWDPVAESSRFVEEAKWAAANGLWNQAARAIEVAVALGDRKPDLLDWRWKSYARLARNIPERNLAGGFRSEVKGAGPAAWQVLAMARSVLLCRQNLPNAGAAIPGRFRIHPHMSDSRERYGMGPVAEASALLANSGKLLRIFADRRLAPDPPVEEALQELRGEIRQLFAEIVRVSPDLHLQVRSEDVVPPWNAKGDPRSRRNVDTGFPFERNKGELLNAHIERLRSGRLWEETPEPYYAYVRQCLASELPADPYFFQTVIHLISEMAGAAAFIPKNRQGPEWREFAKSLAQDKAAGLQVGATTILCRTGLPLDGFRIFEARKEAVLTGVFPLEYLLHAFSTTEAANSVVERLGNGPLQNVTGVVVTFVAGLLDEGLLPSRTMLEFLVSYKLSDRQAGTLLAALRKPPPAVLAQSTQDDWDKLAGFAFQSLAVRAGESPAPLVQASPPVPSPAPSPSRRSAASLPIPVDLAWVAKNPADPAKPGAIRWVIPQDDKIWLQVEFGSGETPIVKRQFVVVDLPSLKSRILYRDAAPDLRRVPFPRKGPTFAVVGDAIYFWDGEGISAVRVGDTQKLKGPDLVEPFLWPMEGYLYAADRIGVFVRYDLRSGAHEILASPRRRPPVSSLDAEPGLAHIHRVLLSEGKLTISMNGQIWREQQKDHWDRRPTARSSEELVSFLEEAWMEIPALLRMPALTLLMSRAGEGGKPLENANPLSRFLDPPGEGERAPARAIVRTAVVSEGVLWGLLSEFPSGTTKLLRFRLSDEKLVCRPLDFSPEFEAALVQTGGRIESSVAEMRMIPLRQGLVLFKPGDPVLWFISQSLIDSP